jgi:hypothetical protein
MNLQQRVDIRIKMQKRIVVTNRKLEAGKEYINTAGSLLPPKAFVDTLCNPALKCNETTKGQKSEGFLKISVH